MKELLISLGFAKIHIISDIELFPGGHLVKTPQEVGEKITSLLEGVTRGFLYLTGHGKDQGFVCPQGMLPWSDLHTAVFRPLKKESEIIMVVDACHGWHFQLPYCLSQDRDMYRFTEKGFYPSCRLVLFTTEGKEAAATLKGSLVTKSLLEQWEKREDSYSRLRHQARQELTATATLRDMQLGVGVYATYPTLFRLWPWFWQKEKKIHVYTEGVFLEM
jgi:hypothetical protein